ncbi:MAG: 16S rRNA (uracil(1498)-N(3))-methyltransferase [Thermodesulfobacteriota bacterium]
MARFYIPHPIIKNGKLRIEGSEVRHIRRVLRLKAGDGVVIFDGEEKEYQGTIIKHEPRAVIVRIQKIIPVHKESPLEITAAQSILKGEKMDYFIQKAAELGVVRIIPFFSSRSVPLLDKSKRLSRYHRWQKIAIEASKQCGRGKVPEVLPLQDFSEMIRLATENSIRLILWEKERRRLKEIFKEQKKVKDIIFVVGPEGGFGEKEIEEAQKNGFITISLGERILRAETASLCLLSILQYEWGDIG